MRYNIVIDRMPRISCYTFTRLNYYNVYLNVVICYCFCERRSAFTLYSSTTFIFKVSSLALFASSSLFVVVAIFAAIVVGTSSTATTFFTN